MLSHPAIVPDHSLKFQLHYFFNDASIHSMNAFIRNDNEKDLLLIFKEVARAIDVEINIESKALKEQIENLLIYTL